MFSRIRSRITYANVAVTLALVFAMSGGAYAAGHYLITSTKQISPKVLKALAGKPGPAGAPGAAGALGPSGAQGPAGPAGPAGTGSEGREGKEGKEGKAGKNGTTGFTETLPKGMTETGAWSVDNTNEGFVITAFSFNIPLASALDAAHVHYILLGTPDREPLPEGTVESTACKGSAEEPTAEPGNLCVYETDAGGVQLAGNNITPTEPPEAFPAGTLPKALGGAAGAARSGAGLYFKAGHTGPGLNVGVGTWAVTAK